MLEKVSYRPEIDGLRAVAVLSVILFHSGLTFFSGGYVGVDIFFVISGYLITSLILSELDSNSFSLLSFYERRVRRILPALFVVSIACVPFFWVLMLPSQFADFSISLLAAIGFYSNFFFNAKSGYFAADMEFFPLVHTWSLSIEEQFYIVFPVFLIACYRTGQRGALIFISCGGIGSLLLMLLGANLSFSYPFFDNNFSWVAPPNWAFWMLPTRAWELLSGSALAFAGPIRCGCNHKLTRQGLSLIGLLLIAYSIVYFDEATAFPNIASPVPVIGTLLVLAFAKPDTLVSSLLSQKVIVGIGLISYSSYLWHVPMFVVARLWSAEEPSIELLLVLSAGSLVLGWLTFLIIERPFRNKRIVSRKNLFLFLGSAAGIIFIELVLANLIGASPGQEKRNIADLEKTTEERSAYVINRFNSLLDKPYTDPTRVNVLLVGDSFASDFTNVLYEAGLESQLEIATVYLESKCAKLLGQVIATKESLARVDPDCVEIDFVTSRKFRDANMIVIAFSWSGPPVGQLSSVIRTIYQGKKKKFFVVGDKDFGYFNLAAYQNWPRSKRGNFRNNVLPTLIEQNRAFQADATSYEYIDLHRVLCDRSDSSECRLFDNNGMLLTYDGSHLTQHGARYLAQGLGLTRLFVR
jgi:peptidoglycan/LPS O-acetylase OafA/YrhL